MKKRTYMAAAAFSAVFLFTGLAPISVAAGGNPEGRDSQVKDMSYVESEILEESSKPDEWRTAFIDYIDKIHNNMQQDSSGGIYAVTELYKLVDINGDEIPELYVNTGSTAGGDYICAYLNGVLTDQYMWNYGFSYIEGQNLFRESGGHMDVYYDKIYCIKDGEFVLLYSGEYGAEDNTQVMTDSNGFPIYVYNWNGQAVSSESEYMELLNQVYDTRQAVSPFDGTTYDDENARYVGNELCDYDEIINAVMSYGEGVS